MAKKKYIARRKGYATVDFNGIQTNSTKLVTNMTMSRNILDWIRNDIDLRASFEKYKVFFISSGYNLIGNKQHIEELNNLRFHKLYGFIVSNLKIYRNAFIEIHRDLDGKVKGIHPLETSEMEIETDEKGKISRYIQYHATAQGKGPVKKYFSVDEVVHITGINVDTSHYADPEIRVCAEVLQSKELWEGYRDWLIKANMFRPYINIPYSMRPDEYKEFNFRLKQAMIDPTQMLIIDGNKEVKVQQLMDYANLDKIQQVINDHRSKIYALMQIPPINMGILDNSNRSSAEFQVRYDFYASLKADMHTLEDELNYELFKTLGFDVKIRHKPLDDKIKMELMQMAQSMLGMNFKKEAVVDFLNDNGFNFKHSDIKEPELIEGMPNGPNPATKGNNVKLDKNSTLHPSRQKKERNVENTAK